MKYMITWCEYNHNESTDNLQCAALVNWKEGEGHIAILYDTKEAAQNEIKGIIRDEAENYLADYDAADEMTVDKIAADMIQDIHGDLDDFDYIRTEKNGIEAIYTIVKVAA